MTKAKQKKIRELAGENFRYLEFVPGDMVKKLNAAQVAALCALISDQRLSAVQSFKLEVAAKRLARDHALPARHCNQREMERPVRGNEGKNLFPALENLGEWVKSARLR